MHARTNYIYVDGRAYEVSGGAYRRDKTRDVPPEAIGKRCRWCKAAIPPSWAEHSEFCYRCDAAIEWDTAEHTPA